MDAYVWLILAPLAYLGAVSAASVRLWLRDRRRPDPLDEAVALGNGGRE